MTKPIMDDFNGVMLDAEDDTIYSVTIVKRNTTDAEGNRQLLKLEFDLGQESFMEGIAKNLEGKKVLRKWMRYVPPTKEGRKNGEKGSWERVNK